MSARRTTAAILMVISMSSTAAAASGPSGLTTIAEQSGNRRTGRYEEVQRLCPAFEKAWPKQVRCFEFGRSPEGRPMLALAASGDGVLDAAGARRAQRPVVLMQGGIHAGEIDGKDAGFLALREMLEGKVAKSALAGATLVFVPVLNVDGHERFGRWNRPNQVGPEEMGWRTTAHNLNLNRDYVKAEAPEMQAICGSSTSGTRSCMSTCTSRTAPSSSTTFLTASRRRWRATTSCGAPAWRCATS